MTPKKETRLANRLIELEETNANQSAEVERLKETQCCVDTCDIAATVSGLTGDVARLERELADMTKQRNELINNSNSGKTMMKAELWDKAKEISYITTTETVLPWEFIQRVESLMRKG